MDPQKTERGNIHYFRDQNATTAQRFSIANNQKAIVVQGSNPGEVKVDL